MHLCVDLDYCETEDQQIAVVPVQSTGNLIWGRPYPFNMTEKERNKKKQSNKRQDGVM